jgi:hypothetical protein
MSSPKRSDEEWQKIARTATGIQDLKLEWVRFSEILVFGFGSGAWISGNHEGEKVGAISRNR